jgi:hypothetical protein
MDSSNPTSTHAAADPSRRSRRTALIAIGVFMLAVVATGVVFTWQQGSGRKLILPIGSMEYIATVRGSPLGTSSIHGEYATDMDGVHWMHSHAPPLTWQNHAHRITPKFLQQYLPKGWKPRPGGFITVPYADVMQWNIQGHFEQKTWRLTWEDENGHESEGTANALWGSGSAEIFTSGALPPSRSRKVILRVREQLEDKPVKEWPLIGELTMNNPALAKPPLPAVDKLPATRTQHGVALTLEAVTVNSSAPDNDGTTLELSMPQEKVQDWIVDFQFFDERRTGVNFSHTSSGRRNGAILLSTPSSLWSDAPWHVRVSLTPRPGLPPRVGTLFKFAGASLPGKDRPPGSMPKTETAGGYALTLENVTPATKPGELTVTIKRPSLPRDRRLRIVSATDDLGRKYEWQGGYNSRILSSSEVQVGFRLSGPADLPKSLDVVAAIDELITFDFCVMPEFKDLTK